MFTKVACDAVSIRVHAVRNRFHAAAACDGSHWTSHGFSEKTAEDAKVHGSNATDADACTPH